jgi:hypothetical protein
MIDMEDSVYRNKYAVKCALGIIKALRKLNADIDSEKAKFGPEHEKYLASPEYKKLVEELKKKDEDDDYRNDSDPQGFDLYKKCVSIISLVLIFYSLKTPFREL